MSCEPFLLQLLEADPQALVSRSDGELAEHLKSCPRCGSVATAISRDTDLFAARALIEAKRILDRCRGRHRLRRVRVDAAS